MRITQDANCRPSRLAKIGLISRGSWRKLLRPHPTPPPADFDVFSPQRLDCLGEKHEKLPNMEMVELMRGE